VLLSGRLLNAVRAPASPRWQRQRQRRPLITASAAMDAACCHPLSLITATRRVAAIKGATDTSVWTGRSVFWMDLSFLSDKIISRTSHIQQHNNKVVEVELRPLTNYCTICCCRHLRLFSSGNKNNFTDITVYINIIIRYLGNPPV